MTGLPIPFNLVLWVACLAMVLPALGQDGAQPGTRPDTQPDTKADAGPDTKPDTQHDTFSVLVYSRTAGFRHASIPAGIKAVTTLGEAHGFSVESTEDPHRFTDETLATFDVVVFMNTTGDVLDDDQQAAFTRFIRGGGGYVGVHSAADTEYDWPWYGKLVGAYFKSHPRIQKATVLVTDRQHLATRHLPARWVRTDEWYVYRENPRDNVKVLAALDETTYKGGGMDSDHPIAWYHLYDGGRAFYTGGGHTDASYTEPDFRNHLLGGILWASGQDEPRSKGDGDGDGEGEGNGAGDGVGEARGMRHWALGKTEEEAAGENGVGNGAGKEKGRSLMRAPLVWLCSSAAVEGQGGYGWV